MKLKILFFNHRIKEIASLPFSQRVKLTDEHGTRWVTQKLKETIEEAKDFAREYMDRIGADGAVVCKPTGRPVAVVGR